MRGGKRSPASRRKGLAALEVVLITAVVVPMAALLYIWLEEALQNMFFVIGNAVGWPFL